MSTDRSDHPGKSPHAFMREALDVQSRLVEQRRVLIAAALAAEHNAIEHSTGYTGTDVDAYFDALAARLPCIRPPRHAWRK